MTLKCSHCGAPLSVAPDQKLATCGYCHAVTRVASTRHHPRVAPRENNSRNAWIAALAMAGVAGAGAIAAVTYSRSPTVTQQSSSHAEAAPVLAPVPPIEVERERHEDRAKPTTEPDTPVTAPPAPARAPQPKAEPAPTGPVSTKKQAEEVLRPEVLACMKEHGVHYLITRLGNRKRGSTVPPLGLTGTSIVDYKPTPGFAKTPLGRCIARAASAVRAPAYGGNYIYFGLRNDSIPDPLAASPAQLDTAAAKRALAALDDEARDCSTRAPAGSRPGESVSVMVFFEGATGEVAKVEPYYVDIKSAYGRCLASVYRKATVGTFRQIEGKVVHVLAP
jgi:hypothetical protein